jgi:hypothetical protein
LSQPAYQCDSQQQIALRSFTADIIISSLSSSAGPFEFGLIFPRPRSLALSFFGAISLIHYFVTTFAGS